MARYVQRLNSPLDSDQALRYLIRYLSTTYTFSVDREVIAAPYPLPDIHVILGCVIVAPVRKHSKPVRAELLPFGPPKMYMTVLALVFPAYALCSRGV